MRYLAALSLLFLASCTHWYWSLPAPDISTDGGTAAFLPPEFSPRHVTFVDLASGASRYVSLDRCDVVDRCYWIGDQFIVIGGRADVIANYSVNPRTGVMSPTSEYLSFYPPPFIGVYDHHPCVYAFDGRSTTDVLSLPGFSKIARLDFPAAGLGDGYMLRPIFPPGPAPSWDGMGWSRPDPASRPSSGGSSRFVPVVALDILDPDRNMIAHINKAPFGQYINDDPFSNAALSPDHRQLLLTWRPMNQSAYIYPEVTVFDVASARMLWHFSSRYYFYDPVLTNEGLFCLESSEIAPPAATQPNPPAPERALYLTCRTDASHVQRILRLPLLPGDTRMSTGVFPNHRFLAVRIAGRHPRLLLVPLLRGATVNDIRQVPLLRWL